MTAKMLAATQNINANKQNKLKILTKETFIYKRLRYMYVHISNKVYSSAIISNAYLSRYHIYRTTGIYFGVESFKDG